MTRDKSDHGGRGRTSPLYCGHCDRWCGDTNHGGDKDDDPCITSLPGDVANACCGHGEPRWAYVQSGDGECVRGEAALVLMRVSHPQAGRE